MNIQDLRQVDNMKTVVFGNHAGIIQSILDFDYLCGKTNPSVVAIISARQRFLRYFWGPKEIIIPVANNAGDLPELTRKTIGLFAVAQSGRRVLSASEEAISAFPKLKAGMIFAEGVPERHALQLREIVQSSDITIVGPASVGLLVGGQYKLGAIGGTLPEQIVVANITQSGSIAVISTSGGMINELINMVASNNMAVSFAAAVGGERFPVTRPIEFVKAALEDADTKAIILFGELGGYDEYDIAEYLKTNAYAKPIVAYIAGTISESFESAPQFGHAKALAQNQQETASAKREALRAAGVKAADSFSQFEALIADLPGKNLGDEQNQPITARLTGMDSRNHALFANTVSSDAGGEVKILGQDLLSFIDNKALSSVALSMFLGKSPKSEILPKFFDMSLRLLVDHGPQVSGAVNTMITARAGKDLTAALASGLLTIGPRFGGAINEAALNWLEAVDSKESPYDFVERFASKKQYIPGIGHRKYSVSNPDPRVIKLLDEFGDKGSYSQFALEVQKITSDKKAQLILNVDGLIAALLLDILAVDEGYSSQETKDLIDSEFCNAIFVYARTVGFIAHYLDQKRLDEGLFRLPDDGVVGFSAD